MSVSIFLVPAPELASNQPSDAEIAATATAITAAVTTDLAPAYGQGWGGHYQVAALGRGAPVPASSPHVWLCRLQASISVPNALGYHTRDALGNPVLYVDVVGAASHERPWSLVASHEIFEAIGNRWVDGGVLADYGGGQGFYYQELCDTVEGQPAYNYHHNGVEYAMANFVTANYWVPGGPYDHLGYVHTPLTPAPGGSQAVFPVSTSVSIGGDGNESVPTIAHPGVLIP